MKAIWGFMMVLAIALSSFANVNWQSYEGALTKAKNEDKILLIYIYSPECHYCKEMDNTTFKDKQVANILNKYFVPVKVRKCKEDGLEVRKEYGYLGTPTFHFIDTTGKKLKSIFGAWKKDDFLKILKYFYERHYKTESMTDYFIKE